MHLSVSYLNYGFLQVIEKSPSKKPPEARWRNCTTCAQVVTSLVSRIVAVMHRPLHQLPEAMHAPAPLSGQRGTVSELALCPPHDDHIRAEIMNRAQHSTPSTAQAQGALGHTLTASDLPLVATLLYLSNPAISLWRGGVVPCTQVAQLVPILARHPEVSLQTIWNLPDGLVPPWLKMFHFSCKPMLPMHACALLSTAVEQLRSAEPLHLHPTSTEDEPSKQAHHSDADDVALAQQFITDSPRVMQPADSRALRAALLNHALLTWYPNASKLQMSRKDKRSRGPTAAADSARRVILDVAALARMLDMSVGDSTAVSSAATDQLARCLLISARIDVKNLHIFFSPKKPDSRPGLRVHAQCITPMQLNLIAKEARARFSELEELLYRRGGKEDYHICMSGVYRGRPDWQRQERLFGLRWLQVRLTVHLLSHCHITSFIPPTIPNETKNTIEQGTVPMQS